MGTELDVTSADYVLVVGEPGATPTHQRRIPFDNFVAAIAAQLGLNNEPEEVTDGN